MLQQLLCHGSGSRLGNLCRCFTLCDQGSIHLVRAVSTHSRHAQPRLSGWLVDQAIHFTRARKRQHTPLARLGAIPVAGQDTWRKRRTVSESKCRDAADMWLEVGRLRPGTEHQARLKFQGAPHAQGSKMSFTPKPLPMKTSVLRKLRHLDKTCLRAGYHRERQMMTSYR